MKTRCPSCGSTFSLDALIAHDGAREAVVQALKISDRLGGALVRYLGLFRPEQRELTMDRVAKLLGELQPDLQAQRIQRNGQTFEAPADAWIWAIDQILQARDAGRLKTPLKSHGYLYEVISNWRPAPGAVVTVAGTVSAPLPEGRLIGALTGLEAWKHGR